jgi:hypothetical protein
VGTLLLIGIPMLLFGALAILLARTRREVESDLARKGLLALATVLEHDGDNLLRLQFTPVGASSSITASHWAGGTFLPGARVMVRYNPLCPWVNRLALDVSVEGVGDPEEAK